ncbi:hypothetical protein Hdeb2414_s0004g00132271 [Helianthus debilis subsp. tardiflorus]
MASKPSLKTHIASLSEPTIVAFPVKTLASWCWWRERVHEREMLFCDDEQPATVGYQRPNQHHPAVLPCHFRFLAGEGDHRALEQ